jgi:hypothetical protein
MVQSCYKWYQILAGIVSVMSILELIHPGKPVIGIAML